MVGISVKQEEVRQHEREVLRSFGVSGKGTAEQREAAEVIAARTREVMKQNGGTKYHGFK